ncbi:BMA-HST-2 [Dirofilaria immitis]|nr:BMA-HST-2 [Dirofilaria immitis]
MFGLQVEECVRMRYDEFQKKHANLRHTNRKIPPNETTIETIHKNAVYIMEREFYDFARKQFNEMRRRMLDESTNELLPPQCTLAVLGDVLGDCIVIEHLTVQWIMDDKILNIREILRIGFVLLND